eukprot:scpid74791/ scgid27408/ Spondin-2; Differentially expressed in cancerous and non-cancerous lung cells 1; Mindin
MERSLSLAVLTVLLVASTQAQTLPSGCSCSASGLATYTFTFDADWIDPSPPVGAHWSWPIGAAHSPCTVVWRDGQLASAGVKQVAELGSTGTIQNEFTAAKVLSTFRGNLLGRPLGITSRSFTVNRYYPLVSALSMIAPSPDWFVGVDSFSLCSGSTWTSSATIPLYAWDAGTDSGLTFGAANLPTSPPENIARLAGARAANTNFQSVLPAVPLGNFTFRLSSVDSTATVTDPQCSMCIAPTTQPLPTTGSPTTASPTTASPTTGSPTTASPTTASPTTGSPTTASPTTASPTTGSPTTASPTTTSVMPGGGCPQDSIPFGKCPTLCNVSDPTYNCSQGQLCCADNCGGAKCTKACPVLRCSPCTAYVYDDNSCPTCQCQAATTPPPVSTTTAVGYQIGGGCPDVSTGFGICPTNCDVDANCTTAGELCCKNQCGSLQCTAVCTLQQCPVKCAMYTLDSRGCQTCTCIATPPTTKATTVPRTTQLVAQTTAIPTSNVTIGGGCPKQSGGFGICPSNCGPSKPCTTTGDQCCANTCGGTVCTKPCAVLTCSSSCTAYTNDVLGCPTCTCTVLTTAPPTKPATTGRTSTKPATTGRTSTKPSPQTTVSPTTTQPSATTPASQIGGGCPVVQAGFGICPTDCSRDSDCTTAGQLCCKNQCRGLVCAAACARLTCALACATFATDTRGCPVCACSTAATKPSTTQATTNRPTTAPRTTGPRATTGTSTTNAMTSAAGQSSRARTTGASMTTASGTIGTRMPSSPSSSGPQEMTPSMSRRTTRIPVGTSASMAPQTPSPTTIVTEATRPPTTIPEIAIGHDVEVTLVLSIGSAAALDGVSTHEDEFVKFVIAQLQTSYGLSSEQIDDEGKFKVSSNTAASHTVQVTVTMKATSNQDTAPFEVASRIQSDVESGRLTLTNFEVGSQSYAVRPAQASTQVTDDVYEPEESSSNTGAIVGGVIGGLCGVVGFVSLVYYLRTKGDSRHRHRKGSIPMRSPTISQSTMTGSLQFEADAITNEGATDHATV